MAKTPAEKSTQKNQKAKAKAWAANRHKLIDEMEKRGPGQPKAILDEAEIERMASEDATAEEIASFFGVSKDMLYHHRNYFDAMKRGRDKGNTSLKKLGFEIATQDRNVNMAIFLLKTRCGYNDGGNQVAEQKPFKEKPI